MSTLRTRIAGWPLRIVTQDGEHVMRFTNEAGERPATLNQVWLRWNDRSMDEAIMMVMTWMNSGVPQFFQPHFARTLRLAMRPERKSKPLPVPSVTEPDPRYQFALWYRGCRVAKITGYDGGCVEIEYITQGGEMADDCVPTSEVTIRPFRK